MKENIYKNLLFKVLFLYLLLMIPFNSGAISKVPNTRIIATLSATNSTLAIDRNQGIHCVKVSQLIPLRGLDFKKAESLKIKIVVDGIIDTDMYIASYLNTFSRRESPVEMDKVYTDFNKIVITIYDINKQINFTIDMLLYLN